MIYLVQLFNNFKQKHKTAIKFSKKGLMAFCTFNPPDNHITIQSSNRQVCEPIKMQTIQCAYNHSSCANYLFCNPILSADHVFHSTNHEQSPIQSQCHLLFEWANLRTQNFSMYETITPQTRYLVLKLLHLYVKLRLITMPAQSVDHSVCGHLVYRLFSLKTIQLKFVQADRPFDLAALNLGQRPVQTIETACVFVCTPLNLQVSLQTIQAGRQFGLLALL